MQSGVALKLNFFLQAGVKSDQLKGDLCFLQVCEIIMWLRRLFSFTSYVGGRCLFNDLILSGRV